jgi:nitrate reductase assembly molybdenum cofactor insertion protein NarJ
MTTAAIHLYKIASLGLAYPDEEQWTMLEDLLSGSDHESAGDPAAALKNFREYFTANKHRIRDLESEYLRLFDMGGVISPYETEYLHEKISRKPFELADIAGFYQAFGFGVRRSDRREPVDHVAVELEFMAILAFKEQYAEANRREDHLAIVRDARKKFFAEHLALWGFVYCSLIKDLACDEYYKRLGTLLKGIMTTECTRHGLDAAQYEKNAGGIRSRDVTDEELACGQQFTTEGV